MNQNCVWFGENRRCQGKTTGVEINVLRLLLKREEEKEIHTTANTMLLIYFNTCKQPLLMPYHLLPCTLCSLQYSQAHGKPTEVNINQARCPPPVTLPLPVQCL